MRYRAHRAFTITTSLAALGAALFVAACASDGTSANPPASAPAVAGMPAAARGAEKSHEHGDDRPHEGRDKGGVSVDHHGNPIHDTDFYESTVQDGAEVEFTIQSFLGVGGRGADLASEIVEGANSAVIFNLANAKTREPIAGVRPLAWMNLKDNGQASCETRVQGYLSGALTQRPIVDFNSFFVLALNDDPLISVIDPNVDVGGYTQLYTVMLLQGRGEDWAMNGAQDRLLVTVPSHNALAIADLDSFIVVKHVDVGPNPVRVVYRPGGAAQAWVGNDMNGAGSGVTVVDIGGTTVVGHVDTGSGHHEIAFSPDGRLAYVTNESSGTLTIIDAERLATLAEVRVGRRTGGLAVSTSTGVVYVSAVEEGDVALVDPATRSVVGRIPTGPGPASVHMAPGGRWGFATNEALGVVHVFDIRTSSVRYAIPVTGGPDHVTFTEERAYVHSLREPQVLVIPLEALGRDSELEVTVVPVGRLASTRADTSLTPNPLFTAPGAGALLIANPADDQVYFYPEGATAVAGSFQGHGLRPRSVQVLDRQLRETSPGVFTGKLRIPSAGDFEVAFLLDSPRVVHCFDFTAGAAPAGERLAAAKPRLEFPDQPEELVPRQAVSVRFALVDASSAKPLLQVNDARALVSQVGGNWSQRLVARHVGDGIYELVLAVPSAGRYQLFVAIPSLGARFGDLPSLSLTAVEPG